MAIKVLENYEFHSKDALECDAFIYFKSVEPRSSFIISEYLIKYSEVFEVCSSGVGAVIDADVAIGKFRSYVQNLDKGITLVLDISCMPREYMAEILAVVNSAKVGEIELIAIYALAAFSPPSSESIINEAIEPVHQRFAGWSSPDSKPTSLILGLGYEPDRAEGASEFFEPSDQWLFVPKSPVQEFFNEVALNNRALLAEVGKRHVIEYDVLDPSLTFAQLEMVIGLLLERTNPVLLPFGPKIFFFLCLIQCLQHPKLGVWHFSNRSRISSYQNISASGKIAALRCLLS